MKVLISKKTGSYYYYRDGQTGDFHCKEGAIKEKDIKKGKSPVFANTNREFLIFEANNYDYSQKIKRGPQILTPKDLGYIAARVGMSKDFKVVEAGGGSGGATIFFSRIAKEVKTYEIKKEHCDIIQKNIEDLKLKNLTIINKDLSKEIQKEKDIDLLFLDMPDPCSVLQKNLKGVKSGSYIVCYVPSISQVQETTKLVSEKEDLYHEEITEVILRHWRVDGRISRPEHRKEIDHTAFLVFIRKV